MFTANAEKNIGALTLACVASARKKTWLAVANAACATQRPESANFSAQSYKNFQLAKFWCLGINIARIETIGYNLESGQRDLPVDDIGFRV